MKEFITIGEKFSGLLELVNFDSKAQFEVRLVDLFQTMLQQASDDFRIKLKTEIQEYDHFHGNEPLMVLRQIIADHFNVSVTVIIAKDRHGNVNLARQIAMWCSRHLPNSYSLSTIGSFYNRDHATIINATNKIDGLYAVDKSFRKTLDECVELIRSKGFNVTHHLAKLAEIKR